MTEKLLQTINFLRSLNINSPEIGIVLGTGLGNMVDFIEIEQTVEYSNIPNFPLATVEFHKGKLIYGTLDGKKVLAMQGRFHYYEGYSMQEITFPIRVMKMLGIKYLLLSNAAGALNPDFKKGTLMLIDDHINFLPGNPLHGPNIDDLGPRFPDMSCPYDRKLNQQLVGISKEERIILHKGIYVSVMGPNLETRAEYRMFRNFADAVGMSTVPEVIVANHMGLPCAAISVLTDECDPENLHPADIKDILAVAAVAETKLIVLFRKLISRL